MRPVPRGIVVTGFGAVSSLGANCAELWSAIAEGRSGIRAITRFPTSDFSVHTGAVATDFADGDSWDLCMRLACAAGEEALTDAGFHTASSRARVALVFGTGLTHDDLPLHQLGVVIADALCVHGPRLIVSTACSSSTGAIGFARDLLAMDAADVALAGGADILTPEVFAGFHALGVLTVGLCAPFSSPAGTSLGEGAGFLVLEKEEQSRARGARARARLRGFGLSGDAWHETSPDPKGSGIERAIRSAICDSMLAAADVDYVNAHGSGTQANDAAEWLGIQRALDGRDVPVSSTKGALGHAQGAAGVLEAIVTLLAMEHDRVPPTLNFTGPRPHSPKDPVPGPAPRAARVDHIVSVNSAFGGANAALLFSRNGKPASPRDRRPVYLTGVGSCTARPNDDEIQFCAPEADPRGLDPSAAMLTVAAARSLYDTGLVVNGRVRDTTGLLVGQRRASATSLKAFGDSIVARGLAHLSASAFARIVLNAAAGACSKALSLRGPHSVVTSGPASGLLAVILAAELLSTRDDVAHMIAGAVDERRDEGDPIGDAAACVMLGARVDDGRLRIAGWGIAPPGHGDEARALALGDSSRGEAFTVASGPAATTGMQQLSQPGLIVADVPNVLSLALWITRI